MTSSRIALLPAVLLPAARPPGGQERDRKLWLERLDEAELRAAALDGELVAVGTGWRPLDLPEGVRERALALGAIAPARFIAELHTAAWVHGAVDRAPTLHRFCSGLTARRHPRRDPRWVLREVVIEPAEMVEISGIRLTSPLRTIIDLLRFSGGFGDEETHIVRRLRDLARLSTAEAEEALTARRNLPHRARAVARLHAAFADAPPSGSAAPAGGGPFS